MRFRITRRPQNRGGRWAQEKRQYSGVGFLAATVCDVSFVYFSYIFLTKSKIDINPDKTAVIGRRKI